MPKETPNLKRFKGSMQGMREFATLIEQSDPRSRDMIIEAAVKEDERFINQVLRKVVYFEELIFLEETILAEILSKVTPKVLAFALQGMPSEFETTLLKQLGFREKKQFQDERSNMTMKLSEAFVLGAQKQILKMARTLESQNKFVFELADCPRFRGKKKTG